MKDKIHNQSVASFEKQFEVLTQSFKRSNTVLAMDKNRQLLVHGKKYNLDNMDDSAVNQLMEKLQKIKQIENKYVVQYKKSMINDSEIFVFFDKMKLSLQDVLSCLFPQGICEWQLLKIILRDIAEALSYCKKQEIILSNISLNKIFFNSESHNVQLAIFDSFQKHKQFQKELIIGDMCYMAPELFQQSSYESQLVDHQYCRSQTNKGLIQNLFKKQKTQDCQPNCCSNMYKQDVYMFAMIVYNLLSGQKYFSDMLLCEAIQKKQNGDTPQLKNFQQQIPKSFIKLMQQCMEVQPDKRPDIEDIVSYFKKHKPSKRYKELIDQKIIQRYFRTVQVSQKVFKL